MHVQCIQLILLISVIESVRGDASTQLHVCVFLSFGYDLLWLSVLHACTLYIM